MTFRISVLVLIISASASAQDRRPLSGKIVFDENPAGGANIINQQTESLAVTGDDGSFSILAQPGDTLIVSSIEFQEIRRMLERTDFESPIILYPKPAIHELNEVVVKRYDDINAVSLGIIRAGQKTYTPAERRLKTAGEITLSNFLKTGKIPIDPLLNAISGRTAMLKKEVAIERKELFIAYIKEQYEDRYFTNQLKIPAEYVSGFLFFLADNERFVASLRLQNKTMASFLMSELAVKYVDTIACDAGRE